MNDKIEQNVYKVHPLKKICMTIGELPTSYLETMTYYEMLIWFTNFLRDNIIPTVNNNAEAVKELQNLFTELQNYVNNYFDNLDVQEEINNKLDKMVEDGTLQEIISAYLNSKAVLGYDNVASMKNATNLINGSYARTLGYYDKNDGGGSVYKIRTKTVSDTPDDMFLIAIGDSLVAELIYENEINVKCIGAYGDDTHDDTAALQAGLSKTKNIYLPNGTYLISDTLSSTQRTIIRGEDKDNTIIKYTIEESNNKNMIHVGERSYIHDVALTGPYVGNKDISTYDNFKVSGLDLTESPYCVIRNCRFAFLKYGIHLADAWCCSFEHCYALRCYIGIDCSQTSANNDLSIFDAQIEYNDYGIFLGEGRSQSLYNCDIENNKTIGLRKQNEGDIQVINCYFEDKMDVIYANRYVSNILVMGSSFFQNPTETTEAFTPITYTGDPNYTRISVINCNFKNLSKVVETHTTPAILRQGDSSTIKPILINNTLYQMKEFNENTFKGITINNGKIMDYNFKDFTYLSTADGNVSLNPNDDTNINYRLYLPASGVDRTLTLSELTNKKLYYEYQFIIPETTNDVTGSVTFTDSTGVKIHYINSNSVTHLDKGKLIKLIFIGNYSGYDNWQLII